MKTFRRWQLVPSELRNLDAAKARDLFIECFYEAQKETLARTKKNLGHDTDDADMRRTTATIVRVAFKEAGADFEQPTKASLEQVLEALTHKAAAWGTPEDIVEHHRRQLGTMLALLK